MSADNYMLIRKHKGKLAVTMEFASDEQPRLIRDDDEHFSRLEDALAYASNEWTEYGVRFGRGVLPKPKQPARTR